MTTMHSLAHSSQMQPAGPAISLSTSSELDPQNEQDWATVAAASRSVRCC